MAHHLQELGPVHEKQVPFKQIIALQNSEYQEEGAYS
jgi:hypothetical protein